jgi:hypothetical protein
VTNRPEAPLRRRAIRPRYVLGWPDLIETWLLKARRPAKRALSTPLNSVGSDWAMLMIGFGGL